MNEITNLHSQVQQSLANLPTVDSIFNNENIMTKFVSSKKYYIVGMMMDQELCMNKSEKVIK